jgi:DNA-binding winged helix-turn-helix (wHTH) protein
MKVYRFDEYQLNVDRQLLTRNERVIPLSAKLFGILHCLVRSGGRIVTKDELVSEVWRHSDVSDATVVQHVSLLRRALNEEAKSHQTILTVPGRGYRFIPAVSGDAESENAAEIRSVDHALRGEPKVWREHFIGIRHMERRDRNSMRTALKHFNAALGVDRTFAPAWAGLAGAYSNMAFYAFTTWDRVLPQAIEAIDKALYFDSRSAVPLRSIISVPSSIRTEATSSSRSRMRSVRSGLRRQIPRLRESLQTPLPRKAIARTRLLRTQTFWKSTPPAELLGRGAAKPTSQAASSAKPCRISRRSKRSPATSAASRAFTHFWATG